MTEFSTFDTGIIIAMVVGYILFTSWLTYRLRSKTNAQFMTASRSLPAAVVGILLMSEFVGAKSTIGTAQEAFTNGFAASWSVIGASIGFLLFGLVFVRRLYGSGEYTISAAIAQKYGRSTMLTVSLIMIYALLLVNVGNYISGAAAIATVMKVSLPQAMVMIAVVSTFYYVFGGLKGVAYVTVLHSGIKLVGVGPDPGRGAVCHRRHQPRWCSRCRRNTSPGTVPSAAPPSSHGPWAPSARSSPPSSSCKRSHPARTRTRRAGPACMRRGCAFRSASRWG